MGPTFRILQAEDPSSEAVAALMEEMQRHYKVPCPPTDQILTGLRTRPPGAEIIIAELDNSVLAFCAFSSVYPGPGLRVGVFLKELYVRQACRSQGLGRSLMQEIARFAKKRDFARIDWTADKDDQRLLAFYDSIGGV